MIFSSSSPIPYALTAADQCYECIFYKSLLQNVASAFQEKIEMRQTRRFFPVFQSKLTEHLPSNPNQRDQKIFWLSPEMKIKLFQPYRTRHFLLSGKKTQSETRLLHLRTFLLNPTPLQKTDPFCSDFFFPWRKTSMKTIYRDINNYFLVYFHHLLPAV